MCNQKMAETKQKKDEIKQFIEALKALYSEKRILKSINT